MIGYGRLLCGDDIESLYEFGKVMSNLRNKLDMFTNHIINYDWNSNKVSIEIPFYARNVLEASTTAIMGRSDPFRVVSVYKVQEAPEYDLGKKSQSAIEWYGDIIGSKKERDLWNCDNKKENFDRALLGNYQGKMIWEPAFLALSDYLIDKSLESEWLNEIVSETENSNFVGYLVPQIGKREAVECFLEIEGVIENV